MRTSHFPLQTLKETPSDASIESHKLMLRAGMIRKLAAGLYTWLPLGLRVLRKVENIVREEMDKSGGLEVLMPAVQPAELWQESGRWEQYGPELLRFHDRHNNDFCFGPTHEEIITDLARNELQSYRQLPVNYYQIQTKFRDEIRPRFGVMRAREFLMKDAYSFHASQECLQKTYELMYETYSNIFRRCGLDFRAVHADTGSIGGSASHEFHVLADSGEDAIAFSTEGDYAANVELAEAVAPTSARPAPSMAMTLVDTPNARTIEELVVQFDQPVEKTVKTLIVHAAEESEHALVALLVRGDHELNEVKAAKLPDVMEPLCFASDEDIREAVGAGTGSLGPLNMPLPLVVDRAVAVMSDFSAGANIDGKHYFGINWERDAALPEVADLRNVVEGDPSPDGQGEIRLARGVEDKSLTATGTMLGTPNYISPEQARSEGAIDGRSDLYSLGATLYELVAGRPPYDGENALDRIDGVRDAMQNAGIPLEQLTIVATRYSLQNGADAFDELMSRSPRPTAVICGNDVLATGAISRARERGIRVPGEISITGFDDIDLAEVIQPKLTTVHVPHRRMGETAARLLLEIINGQTDCKSVELDTEIVIRESLGPASTRL